MTTAQDYDLLTRLIDTLSGATNGSISIERQAPMKGDTWIVSGPVRDSKGDVKIVSTQNVDLLTAVSDLIASMHEAARAAVEEAAARHELLMLDLGRLQTVLSALNGSTA